MRVRRAEVEASLAGSGFSDPARDARAMYRSLGAALLEFLWATGRPTRRLERYVRLTPRAERAIAASAGRGAVVATAHVGNWDLTACAVAAHAPLTVVTKHLSVVALDRAWQRARAGRGVNLLDARGALARASDAIARGRLVAMLVDQAPSPSARARCFDFLGRPALHDTAAAVLAARARVPLLVAFGRRLHDGRHEVDVTRVLQPPPRPTLAWVEHATRMASRELERYVRTTPGQWLWLHRRWKHGSTAPARSATAGGGRGPRISRRA